MGFKSLTVATGIALAILVVYVACDGQNVTDEPGYDKYAVLGVPRDIPSDSPELKKIYRRMSFKYHPDRNPDDPAAQMNFMEISSAYETISDPERRRMYDAHGERGLRGEGSDMFSQLFGQPRHHEQSETRLELRVQTLDDIYLGKNVTANIERQVQCGACGGSGAKSPRHIHKCDRCGGTGRRVEVRQLGPGFMQQVQTVCNECGGAGKVIKKPCPECAGNGLVSRAEEISISITPGTHDGERLTFPGMGSTSDPRQSPGDLVFVVRVPPHPTLTRRGDHLHAELDISLKDALVGFTTDIPHLAGRVVPVTATGVTSPGDVVVVKGEGLPNRRFADFRGDLHVHITVKFPEELSNDEKQIIKQLW